MKRLITTLTMLVIILAVSNSVQAAVYVKGYFRSNGTYVQPHYRSNPDGNFYNNWSTYPNTNPYTGKVGTKLTPSYSSSYSGSTASIMPKTSSTTSSYWTNNSSPAFSSSSPSYSTFGSSLSIGSSSTSSFGTSLFGN